MKHLFVPYEIAKQLKEKGFDEPCLAYYTQEVINTDKDGNKTNFVLLSEKLRGELSGQGTCKNSLFHWLKDNDKTSGELYVLSNSVSAPLYQQVVDFFREKHDLVIEHRYNGYDGKNNGTYFYSLLKLREEVVINIDVSKRTYKSYYETYNKAFTEALKLT